MLRTTVLLTVTLLAGYPAVSLACEFLCNTPAAVTHHSAAGCHRATAPGGPGEQLVAAAADCPDLPAVTTFLNEIRQPHTRPGMTVSAAHDTPAVLVRGDFMNEDRSVFNGHTSHPPAFRTILRV